MTLDLPLQIDDVQRTSREIFAQNGWNAFPRVKARFRELEDGIENALGAALELTGNESLDRETLEFYASDGTPFDDVLWRVEELMNALSAFEQRVKTARKRLYGEPEYE